MKRLMVGTVNPRLTQFTAALALAIGIGAVVVGPGALCVDKKLKVRERSLIDEN
jgi:hypothetical protein